MLSPIKNILSLQPYPLLKGYQSIKGLKNNYHGKERKQQDL